METMTLEACSRWMRLHAAEYGTSTELAEAAAAEFGVDEVGGPLDDPDHWVWDAALVEAIDAYGVAS
jgi:hypothetical protein